MIVRIAAEGQYRLEGEAADRLNQLDNDAVTAVEGGEEARFNELWRQMLDLVQAEGKALPEDELVESDVILPPRDVSFEEAREGFSGEGLIPG